MTAQTKKAKKNEVNSLLLGSGSNKRRAIYEQETLRAIRLDDHKYKKTQEERIPLKIWNMMTPKSRIAMHYYEEVNIGLVKDVGTNEVKHVGGKISQQHKKDCGKFLLLTQAEEKCI